MDNTLPQKLIDAYFKGDNYNPVDLEKEYHEAERQYYDALRKMTEIEEARRKMPFLKGKVVFFDGFFGRIKDAEVRGRGDTIFRCILEYVYYLPVMKDEKHILERYKKDVADNSLCNVIECCFLPKTHTLKFLSEDEFSKLKEDYKNMLKTWKIK